MFQEGISFLTLSFSPLLLFLSAFISFHLLSSPLRSSPIFFSPLLFPFLFSYHTSLFIFSCYFYSLILHSCRWRNHGREKSQTIRISQRLGCSGKVSYRSCNNYLEFLSFFNPILILFWSFFDVSIEWLYSFIYLIFSSDALHVQVPCSVPYTTILCQTVSHLTVLLSTVPHNTILNYTVLHYTVLHYTTPRYATLHCTALHCTALHCTPFHSIPYHIHFISIFLLVRSRRS